MATREALDHYQRGVHARSAREALECFSRALNLYRRQPGSPPPSPGSFDRDILAWMTKACLAMENLSKVIKLATEVIDYDGPIDEFSVQCLCYRRAARRQLGRLQEAFTDCLILNQIIPMNRENLFVMQWIATEVVVSFAKIQMQEKRRHAGSGPQIVELEEEVEFVPNDGHSGIPSQHFEDAVTETSQTRSKNIRKSKSRQPPPKPIMPQQKSKKQLQQQEFRRQKEVLEIRKELLEKQRLDREKANERDEAARIRRRAEQSESGFTESSLDHGDAADVLQEPTQQASSVTFCHETSSKKKKGRRRRQRVAPMKEGCKIEEGNDHGTVPVITPSKEQGHQRPVLKRRDGSAGYGKAIGSASAARLRSSAVSQVKCSEVEPTKRKSRSAKAYTPTSTATAHHIQPSWPRGTTPLPNEGPVWDSESRPRLRVSSHISTQQSLSAVKRQVSVDSADLLSAQRPAVSFLEAVVSRMNSHETSGQRMATEDNDKQSVHCSDRDSLPVCKLVCRTCFVKQGRVLDETKPIPAQCAYHRYKPVLLWRPHGSDQLIEVRPRPPNAARSGAFVVCNGRTNCGWPHRCRRPHSNEERDAWTWDRDGVLWKTRPPPKNYRLVICRNYQNLQLYSCPYGLSCRFAHGGKELVEWREYRQRQTGNDSRNWRSSLSQELQNALDLSQPSESVVTDTREGIKILWSPGGMSWHLINASEASPYTHQFQMDVGGVAGRDCQLKRAALLRPDFTFTFVDTGPPLSVRDRGLELTHISGSDSTNFALGLTVKFSTTKAGSFSSDLLLDFGSMPYLVQTLRVDITDGNNFGALEKLRKSTRRREGHWDVTEDRIVYGGIHQYSDDDIELVQLYPIPDPSVLCDSINQLRIVESRTDLTQAVYKPRFHTLIYLEELYRRDNVRRFSTKCAKLKADKDARIRGEWETTLSRPVPPKTAEIAYIRPNRCHTTYAVPLISVRDNTVKLDVAANADLASYIAGLSGISNSDGSSLIDVDFQFKQSRTHWCHLHRAIDRLPDKVISTHLLGPFTHAQDRRNATLEVTADFQDNARQREAIKLVLSHCSSVPVIIHGPFGTGKTKLLNEAVRLLTLRSSQKVLICTQSNHAADLYVEEFDQFKSNGLSNANIVRICFARRKVSTVPPVVRKYCSYRKETRQFVMPSPADLTGNVSLVVVTTLITASQLVEARFPSGYFSHIIIDEAAQATEPETLTPLALAARDTVIVLAGDSRQTGPPVLSSWARAGKLQRSLFRRLYDIVPDTAKVHLLTNYRCQYDLLRLTVSLFYRRDEVSPAHCKAPVQKCHPDYHPFSFFAFMTGEAEQEGADGSFCNVGEAAVVVDQVEKILQRWPQEWGDALNSNSICVVSSEFSQVQYIRQLLRRRSRSLSSVSVLTSGSIQGRQFRTVIISTVMTRHNDTEEYEKEPNFLSNVKVLNTAFTRAQSLVLVVGDPDCLMWCKIGEKWTLLLEECHKCGSNCLFGDTEQSDAIAVIHAKRSELNVEAAEFVPSRETTSANATTDSNSIFDLPPAMLVDKSQISCQVDGGSDDEYGYPSSSDSSVMFEISDDEDDRDEVDRVLPTQMPRQQQEIMEAGCQRVTKGRDIEADQNATLLQGQTSSCRRKRLKRIYCSHLDETEMLNLLDNEPDRYIRCLLKVMVTGEVAFGVVPDPSQPDVRIEGRTSRNRAFDGEDVLVELLMDNGEEHDSFHQNDQRRGHVIGIFQRQRPTQFVCERHEKRSRSFVPLNRGHPIFENKRSHNQACHKQHRRCVVTFKCCKSAEGLVTNISETSCIELEETIDKLFVVQFVKWSEKHKYPLGIVTDVIDKGSSYVAGQTLLRLQMSIPDTQYDEDEDSSYQLLRAGGQTEQSVITAAFTIDPEHSEDMDDALSVINYDGKTCEVGVFIADVSRFVPPGSKLDDQARNIGMTVYDEGGRQVCPMLPRALSSDLCSLRPGDHRPVLGVYLTYDMASGVQVEAPRFERTSVRSCCKLSYKDAQMIIDGSTPQLKCDDDDRSRIKRDVLTLYRLSRKIRRQRMGGAMYFRDMGKSEDCLAHELIEEFMVSTNKVVAETLLDCCPDITPLICQFSPKRQKLEEFLGLYGNLIDTSCRLATDARNFNVETVDQLLAQRVCSRVDVNDSTLDNIRQAIASRQFDDIVSAVCTEEFHPQLALINSAYIRSQQKAIYRRREPDDDTADDHHWQLGCRYTHFTSPIRRYADIVCHRLLLQYKIQDDSQPCHYSDRMISDMCNQSTFRRVNMRRYQRERELCRFSCEIRARSVATVAVVEDIKGGHIDLFFPYCPNMPRKNSRIRLSSLNASRCDKEDDGGKETLDMEWCVELLPKEKDHRVQLPENDYVSVDACLWKKLVTEVSSSCTSGDYQRLQSVIDELTADARSAVVRSKTASFTASATPATDRNEESPSDARSQAENGVSDEDGKDKDGFVEVRRRRKIKENSEITSDQGRTAQEMDLTRTVKHIRVFDLLSIQLSSRMMRGLLRPIVQSINFPDGLSICVEHNTCPSESFADPRPLFQISRAPRHKHRHVEDYVKNWVPLVEIESCTASVRASATGTPVLLKGLVVSWTQNDSRFVGHCRLDTNYAQEHKIACKRGDYVCLRYFDLALNRTTTVDYGEAATSKLLRNRSTYELVQHCRIGSSTRVPSKSQTLAFGCGLASETDDEDSLPAEEREILIDLDPCSFEDSQVLIDANERPCVSQMIHLSLPFRRMQTSLELLGISDFASESWKLVTDTIMGKFKKVQIEEKIIDCDRLPVLDGLGRLLDSQTLNRGQSNAINLALNQRITLIQGPPGTGKTVTGVHIACQFVKVNRKATRRAFSGINRQVLYCAPSNEAVDLVTKYLKRVIKAEGVRILRMYGQGVEQAACNGPALFQRYASAGLPKTLAEASSELSDVTLHRRIRCPDCNTVSAQEIIQAEDKFAKMFARGEVPTRQEVKKYQNLVDEAENREIKAANILLCTCIEAGSRRVKHASDVSQCIVDEAGQCTEPETLVALLQRRLEKIVLIGDHMQLQPVVLDPRVTKELSISMFERLAQDKLAFMLNEQYRMHKDICSFPSWKFYDDGLSTPAVTINRPQLGKSLWRRLANRSDKPKCFINVEGWEGINPVAEKSKGGEESKFNTKEVESVVALIEVMRSAPHNIEEKSIRVLTPYTAQKKEIEKALHTRGVRVQVSSISASQGSEADFVILSTVRSLARNEILEYPSRSWIREHLGFVTDKHQINVALTRAKHGLFIVGNSRLLQVNRMWKELIRQYRIDGCLLDIRDGAGVGRFF